jgi:hypothetical protein
MDYRRYGTGISHRFNPALYNFTYDKYLSRTKLNATKGMSYTIQPVSSNVASLQQRNGGSPFVIEPVDQDCKYHPVSVWGRCNVQKLQTLTFRLSAGIVVPISWASAQDDAEALGAANGLRTDIEQKAEQSDDLLDLVFMNDAAAQQSPLRSYGTNSLRKLKRVAREYDSDAVFQRLQYGGFLLSRA